MIETERSEHRVIRQAFGSGAHLIESGGAPGHPGRVEIHLGTELLGSGSTFRAALCDALSFTMRGVRRADQMEVLV